MRTTCLRREASEFLLRLQVLWIGMTKIPASCENEIKEPVTVSAMMGWR